MDRANDGRRSMIIQIRERKSGFKEVEDLRVQRNIVPIVSELR